MQEEEARLLPEEMVMKGGHFDAVLSKGLGHRLDFLIDQNKIPGRDRFLFSKLKIHGGRQSHKRRDLNPVDGDRLFTRDAILDHAVFDFSLFSQDRIDLFSLRRLGLSRGSFPCVLWPLQRGACQLKRLFEIGGEMLRIPLSQEVHIHYLRLLADQVIMNRRDLDSLFFQLRLHRLDLFFFQDNIAEGDRLVSDRFESGPGAERKARLELNPFEGDIQVSPGKTDLQNVFIHFPWMIENRLNFLLVKGSSWSRGGRLRSYEGNSDERDKKDQRHASPYRAIVFLSGGSFY